MLKELESNLPDTYKLLKELPAIFEKSYKSKLKENYNKCEAISIDYAVMEKSNSIYVIPCDFGWDDIGTWNALQRYIKPDEGANIIKGDVKTYNSSNNVVYAGNKKVILLDIDDIFLIESDEMIVVGRKDQLSKVHELRNK
jgi:mannose-1-phosphate guanylyltransferase